MADPAAWDLLDENCSDISDWIDQDSGTAVSEVSPAGQFRLDTNTGAAGNAVAARKRDIGNIPNTLTLEVKFYHDLIGTRENTDYFNLLGQQPDEYFDFRFASNGIFSSDTSSGVVEIGEDLVKTGGAAEWQIWRFCITYTGVAGDGTCDVYLDDTTHDWELVGSAIPCSKVGTQIDGVVYLKQKGNTTDDMVTHVDYIKMATGLYPPNAYNLLDGKLAISPEINLLDGKVQVKDTTTNLLDGKAFLVVNVNLLDGKAYITYTGQIDAACPTPICAMSAVFRYARIEALPPVPTASFIIGKRIQGNLSVPCFTCTAYHGRNPSLIANVPCPTCSMRVGLSLSDIATISRKAGVPVPGCIVSADTHHLATIYGNTPCPLFACDGDTVNVAIISASAPSPTGILATTIGNVATIIGRAPCPSCSFVALTGQVISLAGSVPAPGSLVRFYASLKNETITLTGTAPTPGMISRIHGLTSSVLRHVRGDIR